MQNKFIMFTPLFVLLFACAGEPTYNDKAPVKGLLSNSNNEKLRLELLTAKEMTVVDSCLITKEGKFSFNYSPKEIGFYKVSISDKNFFTFIMAPSEMIEINADAKNLATYQVKGSEESIRFKRLNDDLNIVYLKNDSLNKVLQEAQMKNDGPAYMLAQQKQQELSNMHAAYVKKFIDEKPNSLASLAAVQKLSVETDLDYYLKVEEGLKQTIPNSDWYKNLKMGLDDFRKLAPGSEAPEIMLNDPSGKPIALSSLRGKIVLIDFWASWCRPCRAENPNVVKLYSKYKDKGFEIYGVSLDNNKTAWEGAIAQDGLTWKHVSDLKGWSSSIAPVYKVNSIPVTFLIDKDGKIIAKGLRGEALAQKLEELFK